MKLNILRTTFLLCLCSTLLIAASCKLSTDSKVEPVEKAAAKVEGASINLGLLPKDSLEFKNYKNEAEMKLRENELLIADMKDKMAAQPKQFRMNFEKQLDSLSMQNTRLRNNMRVYSPEGKAHWELFKKSFNEELDALSKSISQITERNANKG